MARPKPMRDGIKILKKAARNNPHKDVRYYYPDHPFIAGYSIPEDEVSLAVEKLNKAFNQSDNYERPQWMWISGPLDDSEISLLEEFVGQPWRENDSEVCCFADVISIAYEYTTKKKFLGLLKSKLRRCCNIQDPDALTWEEIFAAIDEYMSGEQKKGGQTTAASGGKARMLQYAEKVLELLVGEPLPSHKTSANGHWESCSRDFHQAGEIQDKAKRAYRKRVLDVLGDGADDWLYIARTFEDRKPNWFSRLNVKRQEILEHTDPDKKQVNWLEPRDGNLSPNADLSRAIKQLHDELLQEAEQKTSSGKAETKSEPIEQEAGRAKMNKTEKSKIERVADEVENLVAVYPIAANLFRERVKVFNEYCTEYLKAKKKKPDECQPSPLRWEIDDKLCCYYATLAVIHDAVKTKAPVYLSQGLDTQAAGFLHRYATQHKSPYGDTGLDTALRYVRADIEKHQKEQQPTEASAPEKDGQPTTLRSFIEIHCDLTAKPDVQSKVTLLHEYNRKNKIKLPKLARKHRKGQHKYYYVDDLRKNWTTYQKEMPTLPPLRVPGK